jgi:predicted kinase
MTSSGNADRRCWTAEQLALGHDVIVDAVNGPESARARWRDLAGQMDAELKFIVVECGDDRIFQDRIERRSRNIKGFPEPTWEGVLRRRADFPPWTDERLTISSRDDQLVVQNLSSAPPVVG